MAAVAAWAAWQWNNASDARALAQANLERARRAIATSIWNDLSATEAEVYDVRERVGLWQLASGRSTLAVPFLAEWATTPDRSVRFGHKPGAILRALAGPRGLTSDQAAAALDTALSAIRLTTDADQPLALAQAVAALAPTPDQAAAALNPVLAALAQTTDPDRLTALAQAVAALAPRLDTPRAAAALDTVLARISQTTYPVALCTLAEAVAALAPNPEQAAAALGTVLGAIPLTTDADQLLTLAEAIAALAPKLDSARATAALDWVLGPRQCNCRAGVEARLRPGRGRARLGPRDARADL
jgi:ribosomal protein S7